MSDLIWLSEAQMRRLVPHSPADRGITASIPSRANRNVPAFMNSLDPFHVSEMRPAEAIVEVAKEKDCDLVVMASHGRRGLDRLFLGSQTIEVLTYSKTPVLVVR